MTLPPASPPPTALADDTAVILETAPATAAGRPSAFLFNTHRRRCNLRMADAEATALAHNEPITTVPDGRAPSADGGSHRGSGLTSAASAHHLQVAEAAAPIPAPSEPITAVSDGRPLSTAGTSYQGAGPAPTADPHRGTRAGGSSASHFSVMPPPAADDATTPTASAAATLADSSSPDVTVGTADDATAAAPPTVRRRDDDMAVDPALGATALADASQPPPPAKKRRSPDGAVDTADGATAAFAADADGSVTTAGDAVGTVNAAATSPSNERCKRRRPNPAGPAHAARRTAFLAARRYGATDAT